MTKWNTYQLIKSYSCYKCPLVLTVTQLLEISGLFALTLISEICSAAKSHGCLLYKQRLRFLRGVLVLSHEDARLSYSFIIGNKPTSGKTTHRTGYQNICSCWRWQSSIIRCQWDSSKVTPSFFFISLHWYWRFIQCCYCNLILFGESAHAITLHRLCNPNIAGRLLGTSPLQMPTGAATRRPPNAPISKLCPQPGNGAGPFWWRIDLQYRFCPWNSVNDYNSAL